MRINQQEELARSIFKGFVMLYLSRLLLLSATAVLIQGCASLWQVPSDYDSAANREIATNQQTDDIISANHKAEPFPEKRAQRLSISKLLSQAITHLGAGETEEASIKLNQVLLLDPDNKNAKAFVEQMHADPKGVFGEEFFIYKAKRGDSMTRIANKFLRDHLKFYILSRYNGMSDPSSLVRGQKIKIPAQFRPKQPTAYTPKTSPNNKLIKKAQALLADKKYIEAIDLLQDNNKILSSNKIKTLLSNAYFGKGEQLESQGHLKRALSFYKKSLNYANDPGIKAHTQQLSAKIASENQLRLAKLFEKSGQLEAAYEKVNASLLLTPDSDDAKASKYRIQQALVDSYHQQALDFFNEQKLEDALATWNKALTIEPKHLLSKSYRQRCLDILSRQEELGLAARAE